ncbi:hypothetical protein [Chromobacterium sp. Beijing]|uniref:hypothetical protein n=1 Tax=Chromobacterium sp. Beijing TaxID=2735795 RepID=UPI001F3AD6C5|nr:hypothetical protein [Chromobacterium sp. Beijing]
MAKYVDGIVRQSQGYNAEKWRAIEKSCGERWAMLASCAAWLRARASVSLSAVLGGPRINKKIYRAKHDNGYSSLVTELVSQADLSNAMLV